MDIEGLPLTAETTFHYLHFAAEDIPDGNPLFKCCPPIRERDNREKLWQAVEKGIAQIQQYLHKKQKKMRL